LAVSGLNQLFKLCVPNTDDFAEEDFSSVYSLVAPPLFGWYFDPTTTAS
jgi:hypothetical protein